jgi:mono/diheme cytochrome c family protein
VIRVSRSVLAVCALAVAARTAVFTQTSQAPAATALKNPVATTPESLAAGKTAYDANCAACHGSQGQGAVKAGIAISIIAEQRGKQPPDLTDNQWDHGSTDGEIFTVIQRGVPPTMMAGYDGRISDPEIWSIVHYLRALASKTPVAVASTSTADAASRRTLPLADFAAVPITGELKGENTRGQLARVNYLRDEPGGRRFFVNDNNGPLYILDKQTKTFTKYLDFSNPPERPGLFPRLHYERNFASGLISVILDPDYARNGVLYTIHFEDPARTPDAAPRSGVVPGLDLTGYTTTPAIRTPSAGPIMRETVLIQWTDRNIANTTFEGTAREVMRLEHPLSIHPMGDMTFNPAARPGDPDWRVLYIGVGDMGSGEQRDATRLNAQRLDTLTGKILRIIPTRASTRPRARSARTAATASRTTTPSRASTVLAGRPGPTAFATRIASCGTWMPRGRRLRSLPSISGWSRGKPSWSSTRARTTATRCAKARR